jgi:hypothetical protein
MGCRRAYACRSPSGYNTLYIAQHQHGDESTEQTGPMALESTAGVAEESRKHPSDAADHQALQQENDNCPEILLHGTAPERCNIEGACNHSVGIFVIARCDRHHSKSHSPDTIMGFDREGSKPEKCISQEPPMWKYLKELFWAIIIALTCSITP